MRARSACWTAATLSHRIERFDHGSAFAVADMFELVGVIVLVQGMGSE